LRKEAVAFCAFSCYTESTRRTFVGLQTTTLQQSIPAERSMTNV
jgi:hypothetical protein